MADEGMSIVPYSSSNDVVLRHNDSIVVLDRDSQQLVLQNAAEHDDEPQCPYCRRPLRQEGSQDNHHAQPEFINPNYFRMLHDSLPSPVDSTTPPSTRRFVQPALSDGSPTGSTYNRRTQTGHGISSAAFTPDYFKKFFVEETVLGKGGKGVVLLVKHVLDGVSLGHYACKRVPVGDDHEWLEKVLIEVQLLQHLSHQNLVSYRHVWLENAKITTFGPSVPCAFILQQYCNSGDLHNYICGSMQTSTTTQELKERIRRRSKGGPEAPTDLRGPRKLHFDEIYSFFKDITSGLRYLHANGYIHRDLKPNNCLLHKTSDGIRVLVSDFGEVQPQNATRMSTGATGTLSYCAPEVLRREYPDGPFGNFTFKSDIFSLGMILYFLCFAQLPYRNADLIHEEREDIDKLREEIIDWSGFDEGRMRPDLPEQLYTFLWRLLSVDPDLRPSADEVLNGLEAGASANENFRTKRTSSSSSNPEVHVGSRIRPLDDPVDSSFDEPSVSPKRFSRSPVAIRRNSAFDSSGSDLPPVYENTNQTLVSERRPSLGPEQELIVRPRYSTPGLSPGASPGAPPGISSGLAPGLSPGAHEPPIRHLLPPPPGRFASLRRYTSASPPPQFAIQLALFIVKIAMVLQPCTPLAVNPWILYFLILVAGINLRTRSIKLQVASLVLHIMVVVLSRQLEMLCVWHDSAPYPFFAT
ncbi:kinase-like domain-containing protein [Aspergillus granulosus]|uniref:Kinase-like domain-containing protein n=1 Tax=Aspergillus granulosus TaxID=176169 RepID=A0ABR4HFL8_9EURO